MVSSTLNDTRQAERRWWTAMALYVLIGIAAAFQFAGPGPKPSSAESGVSAGRALQTLAVILGEESKPHRAGSKENEEVRIRILGLLDELGLETWQFPFEPSEEGLKRLRERKLDVQFTHSFTTLVARIPGQARARPVVIASHYDSAIAGPGAGDAGQCVAAILETARALSAQPLKYETWILLVDAEEFGLWGSEAFVKQSNAPWGAGSPVVINFDARGDRGSALLFETHDNNLKAIQLAQTALAYPQVSNSLMVGVYKRLPNGTDFTSYRQAGWCGWNFAVVAGANNYHTADDTIENLSPRTIQHFASHAWNLLRRLDQLSAEELMQIDQSEPAVFFDLLGLMLIVYPMSWNVGHLGLAVSLWLISWVLGRFQLRLARVIAVWLLGILIAVVAYGMGWIIVRGLQAADLSPRNFVTGYEWVCLSFVCVSMGLMFSVGRLAGRLGSAGEIVQAVGLSYLVLSALACYALPGGAYLFLWPATVLPLVCMAGWVLQSRLDAQPYLMTIVLVACAMPAVIYAPTYVLLAQALGPRAGMLLGAIVAVMLMPTLVAWGKTSQAKI